ncbi:organic cation/carnitine transporter 2-like [Conger conger]|uniref:organic cation/carnitine transporter 2-like n=1 Tax=Conger conger TaxID=82655 RepID=UPI002A5AE117|nr:organic cation/carnitine transporter 2-like [Conger conger]XP_061103257.1 organic cation/carnitine transporter 2-like [Conger conger]XP_061103258.1 organic cation/carnitine transporter 2-like [Conger conger]
MEDYDEEIAFLGNWGRFQQTAFFLLCATAMPNGFTTVSMIFLGDSPAHHCLIPEGLNITEEWRKASIPTQEVNGETEYSRCRRYRLDLISNFSALGLSPSKDVNLSQVPLEGCSDGWTYSKEIYQSTIVTEFDLVCGNGWKQPFTTSVYFIGMLSGAFFSGQLSDRFGRRPILFITMAIQTVFSFIQAFSPSWEVFSVLFFIVGLGQMSNYISAFVLGTEILTGTPRKIYTSLGINGSYAIGYMILPLLAYFSRDWKTLLLAMSVPSFAYIPLSWLIPESPRWLLSQGRVEEAEAILRGAAKKNRVTAPEVIFTQTEVEQKQSKTEDFHGFLELLKTSGIRHITLILCLVWFTLIIGYIGLSLNTSTLHGSPYLNCFISGATEIPAYIASWLAVHYLRRRMSLSLSMLLGGGLLFFIQLVPPGLHSLAVSLEMIGKFFMASATAFVFVYTGELYPTGIRNTAVGLCSTASRVGSAIAPYFVHLGSYDKNLPYILLGSLTIIAGISVLFLPESFGLPLPDTMDQMPKRERIKWLCQSSEQENKQENGKADSVEILAESLL